MVTSAAQACCVVLLDDILAVSMTVYGVHCVCFRLKLYTCPVGQAQSLCAGMLAATA